MLTDNPSDCNGKLTVNNTRAKFEATVNDKLSELNHTEGDDTHKFYSDMCTAISHAIESTLPSVSKQHTAQSEAKGIRKNEGSVCQTVQHAGMY